MGRGETTAMATHEIPRAEWADFFERFSDEQQGSLVTVDVVGEETGARVQARDLPLVGIELEQKGSEANSIQILLGVQPEDHVRHSIRMPARVCLRDEVQGADV